MVSNVSKTDVSLPRRRLIELMQCVNYGHILDLTVHNGQPVMAPLPRVIREIKFGGQNGPRPEVGKADFTLKAQVRDLFAQMDALGNGSIARLDIQRGLPFKMTIEEKYAHTKRGVGSLHDS